MNSKRNILILLLLLSQAAAGQIHLTPFVGVNSTRLKLETGSFGFKNGGNFLFGGIEVEGGLKPRKISPFQITLVTGVSYLSNGFFQNELFSFPALNYYVAKSTDLSTRYLQMPFMLKFNWQPFPLVEDFRVYLGGGVSNNTLLQAHLTEKTTLVFKSADVYAPPQTTHYEDSKEITDLGVKNSIFGRVDLGLRYRKLQIALRISFSMQDTYFNGLEKTWAVPTKQSTYLSGHASGTIKEKYSELAIGYRLF